jgi:hypothetical protein
MPLWRSGTPHLRGPFPRARNVVKKEGIGINTNIYELKYNK